MKKAFILGGTGFLGYHAANVLLEDGYSIVALSLPLRPSDNLFDERVENHLGDINAMSDEELLHLIKGCEAFVYAIGADERWLPDHPHIRVSTTLAYYQHRELRDFALKPE